MQWGKRAFERLRLDTVSQTVAGGILFFIGISLISLARTLFVRRRRLVALQLTSLPRPQRRVLAKQLRFYIAMLDMLDRRGHVRPAWQSPFGLAQQLALTAPQRFEPVVTLTEMLYEIRFGYRDLNAVRRDRIRGCLRRLERTLKHQTSSAGDDEAR